MPVDPQSPQQRRVLKWVLLVAALLLVGVLVFTPNVKDAVDTATAWATEFMNEHPVGGVLVFFLFSALSAMLAFASSAVLVPPANVVWGQPVTFFLLWGGWLIGAAAAFGIGRLARPLLIHMGYKDKLEKYEQFASKRMKFWAVLLFCFAVPSEVPGYLFGSMHYPFVKFMSAMAIAEAAYAYGAVVAGESLLGNDPLPFFAAIGVLVVVALAASWLLRRLRKRKSGGVIAP